MQTITAQSILQIINRNGQRENDDDDGDNKDGGLSVQFGGG